MAHHLTFKRQHLAYLYCDSLTGKGLVNATSGLFLAGPRRVGKSTFLIEDLMPEAKSRDWLVVYVDLWANKLADPALLITVALKSSIALHKRKLTHLTKHSQLQKVNILKTVELDFSKPGLSNHISLVDLLNDLIKLSNKSVLLIVDEAQHALTTQHGINAMFSLKSARDQINISHKKLDLMLVLTGSNRDKLAQLVIKKDQPFFGSEITPFPLLGRDFIDTFTDKINNSLAANNQFNQDSVWEAFQLISYRPEVLRQIVGQVALNHDAPSFSDLLKQDAFIWHNQIWQEFESEFNSLSPLHQAILSLLIKQGRAWSPFSEGSMQYYKQAIKISKLPVSSVQTAIQSLRDRGFIWQSNRGSYALEDESFAEWFKHARTKNINS